MNGKSCDYKKLIIDDEDLFNLQKKFPDKSILETKFNKLNDFRNNLFHQSPSNGRCNSA